MTESKVYLRDGKTGLLVEASLFDAFAPDHLVLWDRDWVPAMRAFRTNNPPVQKPEDAHWDWRRKAQITAGLLGFRAFSVLCDGALQGILMTNETKAACLREQFGKPLVYVEFLATAPWNRPAIQIAPRFRGVGSVLVLAAIELSRDMGFKGRVGLHSLPGAEPFYERTCGFTRLGPDASHQNLTYFELTETQAESFRQRS